MNVLIVALIIIIAWIALAVGICAFVSAGHRHE